MTEFDIESHVVIDQDIESTPLIFEDPSKKYRIEITNRETSPGIEVPLLRICVIFECESREEVANIARGYLNEFLDICSLTISAKLQENKIIRVMDWSPGISERSFTQFLENSDPNMPMYGLNPEILESVHLILGLQQDAKLKKAIRWYRRGVNARFVEEQFQNFWFAIEVLAQRNKTIENVSDKCQKCKDVLFCRTCQEVSTHRPFAKQAIESIFRKYLTCDKRDLLISDFFIVRNSLLHGCFAEEINKKISNTMQSNTDALGNIVRLAIISSHKFPSERYNKLTLLTPSSYAHYIVTTSMHGSLQSSQSDMDNPNPNDFKGATMELIVTEK